MSDLLDKKLKHFFTLMDRDTSNTLELNDYLTSADQVSSAFGMAAGSAEHENLRKRFAGFWENIIQPMDTNGDGHVTFEEYINAYNAAVRDNPEGYEHIQPLAEAVIALADTQATGRITADNFTTAMNAAFGVPEPETRAAFAALDTQNNGHLDHQQLHAAAQEFFLGTDPSAPANGLFGTY